MMHENDYLTEQFLFLLFYPITAQEETMNAPAPMIRLTTQRQIILEELAKVKTHPTASELYDMVRKRLPRIGLGTVYRNLELMADNGMILKLEVGGTQKRFDATTDPHYHIRCACCGKVDDIMIPVIEGLADAAAETSSYQILGHHVEFSGICPACQEEQGISSIH
jgi:Fur family ferric uptake transcriptional regulator